MQTAGPFTVTTQTNTTNVFSSGGTAGQRDPRRRICRAIRRRSTAGSTLRRSPRPTPFTFGNAGRGIVRADGRINFDFSLVKNVDFWEGKFVQIRWEVFNAINHADFGRPARG